MHAYIHTYIHTYIQFLQYIQSLSNWCNMIDITYIIRKVIESPKRRLVQCLVTLSGHAVHPAGAIMWFYPNLYLLTFSKAARALFVSCGISRQQYFTNILRVGWWAKQIDFCATKMVVFHTTGSIWRHKFATRIFGSQTTIQAHSIISPARRHGFRAFSFVLDIFGTFSSQDV